MTHPTTKENSTALPQGGKQSYHTIQQFPAGSLYPGRLKVQTQADPLAALLRTGSFSTGKGEKHTNARHQFKDKQKCLLYTMTYSDTH